jgi:hypothetical protein
LEVVMTFEMARRIRIEVPSGDAAFLLEGRLRSLLHDANALWDGTRWWVELTGDDAGFDEVVAVARKRLDEAPLGAGYDGPALDHEP